jgi:hypothetical protein
MVYFRIVSLQMSSEGISGFDQPIVKESKMSALVEKAKANPKQTGLIIGGIVLAVIVIIVIIVIIIKKKKAADEPAEGDESQEPEKFGFRKMFKKD